MSPRPRVLRSFVQTHRQAFAELYPAEEDRLVGALGEEASKALEAASGLGWVDLEFHVTHADGSQHKEFRQRAREIWRRVSKQIDYRGKPGRGGQCSGGRNRLPHS